MGLTFESKVKNKIAYIRLLEGVFVLGTDLDEKERFLKTFEELGRSEEVKAVLLINDEAAATKRVHRQFIESLTDERKKDTTRLARQGNAIIHYAMKAMRYEKLLISCIKGEMSTPFLGLSLLSDFRLAEPGMRFELSHADLGVPPTGGLGFWLPRYIGMGLAAPYLHLGGTIDAIRAQDLGLVNEIIDHDSFEEGCAQWVGRVLNKGAGRIVETRLLMNKGINDAFNEYLEEEAKLRFHALHTS